MLLQLADISQFFRCLIWHNFVTITDNWIEFGNFAWIRTYSRREVFYFKILNRWGISPDDLGGKIFLLTL